MKINIKYEKKPQTVKQNSTNENKKTFAHSSYSNPLIVAWGKVLKAYSIDCSCDVQLSSGILVTHVPVRSLEWVGSDGNEGFGERDLPPEDCKVLLLFPDGMIENAFILCSVLETIGTIGDEMQGGLLAAGKETEYQKIKEGGLKKTYDKITGEYTLELNGATIQIDVNGGVIITPASGENIELAGNTKNLVTHAELDSAIQSFITALNAHVHSGVLTGGGSSAIPVGPMSLDISGAEATRLETS